MTAWVSREIQQIWDNQGRGNSVKTPSFSRQTHQERLVKAHQFGRLSLQESNDLGITDIKVND